MSSAPQHDVRSIRPGADAYPGRTAPSLELPGPGQTADDAAVDRGGIAIHRNVCAGDRYAEGCSRQARANDVAAPNF
jgi:hypothetical protein